PGHHLGFLPDRVVLDHSDLKGMCLAPGLGGSLADAMGKTVKKTSGERKDGEGKLTKGGACSLDLT
ncbi:MAG: hypothetical protein ACXW2V_10505, partial [Candidatus Aminicenantales bacterium]